MGLGHQTISILPTSQSSYGNPTAPLLRVSRALPQCQDLARIRLLRLGNSAGGDITRMVGVGARFFFSFVFELIQLVTIVPVGQFRPAAPVRPSNARI
jgi:hypothetical protein